MLDDLLTSTEAARMLRMTEGTVRNLRWQHTGPPYVRLGARSVRYSRRSLERWIRDREVCPR